jgi:ABC-2 type transport system ATP-binding protein
MAWLKEVPAARVPAAVDDALERVDLADRASSRMRTLSGGMLRRAGIAQAIVNSPELLLLDEPIGGLDPEQRVAFRALLRELGTDATVVVSTHLVEDVASACTGVVLLDGRQVVFTGTADELAAAGAGGVGDKASERGYLALLRGART